MQYIRELAEYNGNGRAAVTFGKFDGMDASREGVTMLPRRRSVN